VICAQNLCAKSAKAAGDLFSNLAELNTHQKINFSNSNRPEFHRPGTRTDDIYSRHATSRKACRDGHLIFSARLGSLLLARSHLGDEANFFAASSFQAIEHRKYAHSGFSAPMIP
jgi:hypothetical protein